MGELDQRDPPNENRTVTLGYLNELYAKADRLRELEQRLRELKVIDLNPDGPVWRQVLGKVRLPFGWSIWIARDW